MLARASQVAATYKVFAKSRKPSSRNNMFKHFLSSLFGIGPPEIGGKPGSNLIHPHSLFSTAKTIVSIFFLIYLGVVVQIEVGSQFSPILKFVSAYEILMKGCGRRPAAKIQFDAHDQMRIVADHTGFFLVGSRLLPANANRNSRHGSGRLLHS